MPDMYFTMLPLILAGIANMLFTKTGFYRSHRVPIDGGRLFRDGKRIFGDNKTRIGFVFMILFYMLFQILFGMVSHLAGLDIHCDLYHTHDNTFVFNLLFGFLAGFVYMICELPNSFIKRRLGIRDGKTAKGGKGVLFFIIDQIDSLIGVMFLVYLFSDITFGKYVLYVCLGGITHILINAVLYGMKVRKNI